MSVANPDSSTILTLRTPLASRLGELFTIAALWLSLLMSLDPLRTTDDIVALKYLPIGLLILSIPLFLVSGVMKKVLQIPSLNRLLILATIMIVGSIVPLSHGERLADSYLGRGLNLWAALGGAIIASRPESFERVARAFLVALVTASVIGMMLLVAKSLGLIYSAQGHILHVETTFFVAGLIWLARRWPSSLLRLVIVVVLVWLAVDTGKSTTLLLVGVFILATTVADVLVRMRSSTRRDRGRSGAMNGIMVYFGLAAASGIGWFFFRTIAERATRYENDLRAEMWADRWNKFASSPLVGQLFTDSPVYTTPYLQGLDLSTHNDYLDILASGGMVGFFLAISIVVTILGRRRFSDLFTSSGKGMPFPSLFGFMILCYIASALGNPILPVPRLAVMFWFSIGAAAVYTSTLVGPVQRDVRNT
ncbi:MAG: hypothetical protein HWE26_16400 [Alteromonadaceae bacterium]|nr:hypothetical protein [Alteromonadaceae bacterium]